MISEFANNGWSFPSEVFNELHSSEKSFAQLEFSGFRSLDYYTRRVDGLGFNSKGNVLDAACGMGQWSVALSRLGNSVTGVDINEGRLEVARALNRSHNTGAIFLNSRLENLPFPSEHFNGVFCYGAFMFTRMKDSAREFRRVLARGGVLYLNANAPGWYLHLLLDRGIRKRDWSMVSSVIRMGRNRLNGEMQQAIVLKRDLKKMLENEEFDVMAIEAEGQIGASEHCVAPAYKGSYFGLTSIYEVIAVKK